MFARNTLVVEKNYYQNKVDSKPVAGSGAPAITACLPHVWGWLRDYRTPTYKQKLTLTFCISYQTTIRTEKYKKDKHGQ